MEDRRRPPNNGARYYGGSGKHATLHKGQKYHPGATTPSPSQQFQLAEGVPRRSSSKRLALRQDDGVIRSKSVGSRPAVRLGVTEDSSHVSPSASPGPHETEAQLLELLKRKDGIIEEMEKRISKLVTDLMTTHMEFRKMAYLDDSDLAASWKSLEQSISQLVPRWYDCSAMDPVSVAKLGQLFGQMCQPELLRQVGIGPQMRRSLLEAYIWRTLLTDVFGASGHIWAGKAHDAISNLRLELEDYRVNGECLIDDGEYMQWFSRTASMMDFVYKNDPRCSARLDTIARRLKMNLRVLEKAEIEGGCVEKDLLGVASYACELDFKLAKSNARYMVFMYDAYDTSPHPRPCKLHGMEFDPENMVDVYYTGSTKGSLSRKVDLVLSPGVVKIGSGVGSEYGTSTVMIKRKVLCLP